MAKYVLSEETKEFLESASLLPTYTVLLLMLLAIATVVFWIVNAEMPVFLAWMTLAALSALILMTAFIVLLARGIEKSAQRKRVDDA